MRDGSAALTIIPRRRTRPAPLAIARRAATLVTATLLAAAALAPRLAAAADCTCKGLAPVQENCRIADWLRSASQVPKTRDELEALLDDLTDGSDAYDACLMKTGCSKDEDDMETKLEPCAGDAWGRYLELLAQAHDRMTKIGALAVVYDLYMDEEPPAGVEKRMVATATRILGRESDPIVVAALLKLLEAYDFETPAMVDHFLERMGSDNALLREMAFDAFQRASDATLPFDPHGPPETRARQMKDLREWWSRQPHAPRDAAGS